MNSHRYRCLIFFKNMLRTYIGGTNIFLTSDSEKKKTDVGLQNNTIRIQTLTLYKNQNKGFKDISESFKLVEENIGKTF